MSFYIKFFILLSAFGAFHFASVSFRYLRYSASLSILRKYIGYPVPRA